MESWMNPYKEKLVFAWTSKSYNFNQNTSNRVEGAHAQFKSYLKGNRNQLVELVTIIDKIVNKQWTSIKSKFEDSLRVQKNDHRSQPLLAGLILNVSHYALELLLVEIDRMEEVSKSFGEGCGCRLYTSMGLPCACRLAKLKRKGEQISLDSIHPMWKKLDFSPSSRERDYVDVDAELEEMATQVRKVVQDSPQPVRRSLFQRIKEAITPGSTTKKPPVVVKNRRGRPTKKATEEKKATPPRASSFTSSVRHSPEFSYEPPRSSHYVPPTHKKKQTGKNSITSSESGISAPKESICFPLMDKGHPEIYRYGRQIPKVFRPYVSNITDVIPDGHCGFRCLSLALLGNEDQYLIIRDQLLQELRINERFWRQFFDSNLQVKTRYYDDLYTSIQFRGIGGCSRLNWCEMPECGFIISNMYRIPVVSVDFRGTSTLFPTNCVPADNDEDHIVPIMFVNNGHFVLLTLEGSFPMPKVDPRCKTFGVDRAKMWRTKYKDRIKEYKRIVYPEKDPNVPPETVDVD